MTRKGKDKDSQKGFKEESFEELLKDTLPQKNRPDQKDLSFWHVFKKGVKPLVRVRQKKGAISGEAALLKRTRKAHCEDFSWKAPPQTDVSFFVEEPSTFQGSRQKRRLRRRATPEATLDLHGMTQKEAFQTLCDFVRRARLHGAKTVRVITGKGFRGARLGDIQEAPLSDSPARQYGVLRQALPAWLRSAPLSHDVSDFTQARPNDGGDGAWYLFLKP